jgi:amino acid adenylation domain-containing protein
VEETYVELAFDAALTTELTALGQREHLSLSMTVLAGWATLLARLTDHDEVVISVPTALDFHINLSGELTVEEALLRVRTAILAAREQRSTGPTLMFPATFAWPGPDPAVRASCDLTLDLVEDTGHLVAVLRYPAALFDRHSALRHVGYLRKLLAGMSGRLERPVSTISVLSQDERYRLLVEWNDTAAALTAKSCIHELFEEQVRRTPEATAIIYEGSSLTYAELNARSNQLARYLRKHGVGPDVLVAVCIERSAEMVMSLLAVLKAGGAYVPIDPKYPPQRLAYMIEDAAPRILLTEERVKDLFPLPAQKVIAVDTSRAVIAKHADTDLPVQAVGLNSRNLAYVIYTSGSTGTPKGVMNEHRGMVNRIVAQKDFEAFSVNDICCQKTSISFVDAVFEIFGPLCNGSRLVIMPAMAVNDPTQMAALIARERVTHLLTVPSLARAMLSDTQIMRRLATLRIWTLSGEEIRSDLLIRLQEQLPGCEFILQYGSSEVSSDATIYKSTHFSGKRVPLGRPLPNVQVYVLDAHGALVPIGAIGEICVGGVGVARGYVNKVELTAEHFVRDTFSSNEKGRLYRTGDLGRWRPDGLLECLGRRDHQIKIRGFRVELGEIETQLASHPSVKQALVVAREQASSDKHLIAYVTSRDGRNLDVDQLRCHLQDTLPAYMLPRAFVRLDAFPMTPNGKLNRSALPEPTPAAYGSRAHEPPLGEVENALGVIWRDLLKLESVGRYDNFLELGGHSLLATTMAARIADRFGARLSVAAVFRYPTIAQLAKALGSAASGAMPELRPVELTDGVKPTYPQVALLMDPLRVGFNMCSAMWIHGPLDEDALRRSLDKLVQRQDALRSVFVMEDGAMRMRTGTQLSGILRVITLAADGQEPMDRRIRREVDREWRRPFDLQAGPAVRALLIRLSPVKRVFVFSVHHVVCDEWSVNLIKSELARFYAAELDPVLTRPGALPVRYSDFADWQDRLQETDEYQRQMAHWRAEFADVVVDGSLPPVAPGPADAVSATRYMSIDVPAGVERQLKQFAARRGLTSYVILMAAFHLALAGYSGLEQQVVWSPVVRRSRSELEESVGMYTNLTVIAARVRRELTLGEFLSQIEQKVLQAHANCDISALTVLLMDPSAIPPLPMLGFNFIDLPNDCDWQFRGTMTEPIDLKAEDVADVCALEVNLFFKRGSMTMTVGYNTAVFTPGGVAQIGAALWKAAAAFVSSADLPIEELLRSWRAAAQQVQKMTPGQNQNIFISQ